MLARLPVASRSPPPPPGRRGTSEASFSFSALSRASSRLMRELSDRSCPLSKRMRSLSAAKRWFSVCSRTTTALSRRSSASAAGAVPRVATSRLVLGLPVVDNAVSVAFHLDREGARAALASISASRSSARCRASRSASSTLAGSPAPLKVSPVTWSGRSFWKNLA
eukprot:scaffold1054_cov116-Isochrysis_galbana.AAC.30